MKKKYLEELALAIASESDSMNEVVTACNVIRRVGSKYNPGYNHNRFLECVVGHLKKFGKWDKWEKNG
jgi:hypothetical protein